MDIKLILEAMDDMAVLRRKTTQPLKFKGNADTVVLFKSDGSGTVELRFDKIDWKSGSWRIKEFMEAMKKEGYKPGDLSKAIKDEAAQFQTSSGKEVPVNRLNISYSLNGKPVFSETGALWDFFGKLQAMLKLLD